MIGHVSGVPVEEMLGAMPGAGAGILLVGAWIKSRLRSRRA